MAIDLPVDHALRGPGDRLRLVEAVIAAHPHDECTWCEWKSRLDLTSGEGIFKIARTIIGLGNRDPDEAARYMGGLGYLIVGAGPGEVQGVESVDVVELEQAVNRYVGHRTVSWDAQYVQVQGKDVLLVIVEAPRWGDPIHYVRKHFGGKNGAQEGAVLVRHKASVDAATGADLEMLSRRLLRKPALEPVIPLQLRLHDTSPLRGVEINPESFALWVRDHLQSIVDVDLLRSSSLYASEVSKYQQQLESDQLAQAFLQRLYEQKLNMVTVALENTSRRNLADVQLVLVSVDDSIVQILSGDEPYDARLPALPSRSILSLPSIPDRKLHVPNQWISVEYDHQGPSHTVTLEFGDIRPEETSLSAPFAVVVTRNPSAETIDFGWKLTTKTFDTLAEGELSVPTHVAGQALSLANLIPTDPKQDRYSRRHR